MPDNKIMFSVRTPDGRTEQWNQEQYDELYGKLYEKYPEAQVVRTSTYLAEDDKDASDSDQFQVSLSDGRTERWSRKDFNELYEPLKKNYPDADVIKVSDMSERHWQSKLDEAQAALDSFDKENGEFMLKYEEDLRSENLKQRGWGGDLNDVQRNVTENREKYFGLAKQRKALLEAKYDNPLIARTRLGAAEDASSKREEYLDIASRTEDGGERRAWKRAAKLQGDAAELFSAPSEYGKTEKSGFEQYLDDYKNGAINTFSDRDFWTRGITQISRDFDLRGIRKKVIEAEKAKGRELEESDYDRILTAGEKAELMAFYNLAYAQADKTIGRAEDLSSAYRAGSSAADSVGFMAEFMLGTGIGNLAGKAILKGSTSAFAKWMGESLMSTKAQQTAVKKGLLPAIERKGIKESWGAVGRSAGQSLVNGAFRTIAQPLGTLSNIAQKMNETNEAGELNSIGRGIWLGLGDAFIENWSETFGNTIDGVFGIAGEGLGKLTSGYTMRTNFGKMARWAFDSNFSKTLAEAGFNGFFGEMLEEWFGNAARLGTGLMDKDEFKEFASFHQQLEMAASFAPMSLIGLAGNVRASAGRKKEYEKLSSKVKEILLKDKILDQAGIDAIFDQKWATSKDIADALAPLATKVKENGGESAQKDYETMLRFAGEAGVKSFNDAVTELKNEGKRNEVRDAISSTAGKFWQDYESPVNDAEGNPIQIQQVRVIDYADGTRRYVIAGEGVDESGNRIYATIGEDGTRGFVNDAEIKRGLEDGSITGDREMMLKDYLQERVEATEKSDEARRMQVDATQNLKAVQEKVMSLQTINIGTTESPIEATIIPESINAQGVTVALNSDGSYQRQLSWKEAAEYLGMPFGAKTDAQIEEEEADRNREAGVRKDSYNRIPVGTPVTLVLDENTTEQHRFAKAIHDENEDFVRIYLTDENGEILKDADGNEQWFPDTMIQGIDQLATQFANGAELKETVKEEKEIQDEAPVAPVAKYTDEKGEVNQNAFLEQEPEEWAKWNDARRKDGGKGTIGTINAGLKKLDKDIKKAQKAWEDEANPNERDKKELALGKLVDRRQRLNTILETYKQREAEAQAATAQQPVAETPAQPVAEQPVEETPAQPVAEQPVAETPASPVAEQPQPEQAPAPVAEEPERRGSLAQRVTDILSGKDKTDYRGHFTDKVEYPDDEYYEVVNQWDKFKAGVEAIIQPMQRRVSEIVDSLRNEARQEILDRAASQGKTVGGATLENATTDVLEQKLKGNEEYQNLVKEINSLNEQISPQAKDRFRQNAIGMIKQHYQAVKEQRAETDEISSQTSEERPNEAPLFTVSDKAAEKGGNFYQNENGEIDLVRIAQEVREKLGLKDIPLRLTTSMVEHIVKQRSGDVHFKDEQEAIRFVIDVMTNFDHVRFGGNGTYVFSIENGRRKAGRRAITIILNSDSGEYLGVKTSGYEDINGIQKRPLLWEKGVNDTSATDTASANVTSESAQQGGEPNGNASNQGNDLSENKDSENSENTSTSEENSAGQETEAEEKLTEAQKNVIGMVEGKTPEQVEAEYEARKEEEKRQRKLLKRVKKWKRFVGDAFEVLTSREDIEKIQDEGTRRQALAALDDPEVKSVEGWYDPVTDKAYIYLPDIADEAMLDRKIMHEVLTHKGLRHLFKTDTKAGRERYNRFLDAVWEGMSEENRTKFLKYNNGTADDQAKRRSAADEYLARVSERDESVTAMIDENFWTKLADKVLEILNDMFGEEVFKTDVDRTWLAEDLMNSFVNLALEARNIEGVSSITQAAQLDKQPLSFSYATEKDVEEKIRQFAKSAEGKKLGWTEEQVESIISETADLMRAIHASLSGDKYYDEWAKRVPTMKVDWRDGVEKPVVTWSRANIEYKYDMSADLLCINNEGLETVLASPTMADLMLAINKSTKEGFSSDDYLRLYETLRDMGFVVPCKGCFDAAMRLKMLPSVARKFVDLVNKTIDERNADPQKFDEEVRARAGENSTVGGLPTSAKNKEDAVRIAVIGDNLTEHIKWTDLMSAEGQTQMLSDWGGIFRAWQRTGAGRPKDKLLPEPWSGEIVSTTTTIIGKYGEKTPSYRDINVNQGTGLRRNSHSEFRPILAIDEIQFMREAYLRGLTVFKYMKELDDVRLFGQLGVKFNMSFFPAFVEGAPAAGLDKNGNYIAAEESVGGREFEYTGEDGKKHYDGMRGWEEARKYVNKDVSLSSVVFSIPHLIKSFTDVPTASNPTGLWGSLIPFHSSGATSHSLEVQGLGRARANGVGHGFEEALTDYGEGVTNFEAVQNDRFGEGWEIVEGKKAGTVVEPGHKLEFANGTHYYNKNLGLHLFQSFYIYDNELQPKHLDKNGKIIASKAKTAGHPFAIDYNDKVREIGTDTAYQDAADYYIGELRNIGLIPRFDFEVPEGIFLKMCEDANVDPRHPKLGWRGPGNSWSPVDSPAYYSLWCDYGMIDPATGKLAPHNPVGAIDANGNRVFKLPDNTIDIIKAGVERYSTRKDAETARELEAIEEYARRSVADGRLSKKDADAIIESAKNNLNGSEAERLFPFMKEARLVREANATQKQPVSEQSGQEAVTEEDTAEAMLFSLSRNNRATVESWLNKREDLSEEQRAEVVKYIDNLPDSKTQLATARWFANGTIRIPEDMKKVEQAISVAGKAKVDPLHYSSPMELLDAHAEFKPTEERINPDEVSTLHRVAEYPEGIVVYDVDSTEESRKNMREIINTHFGKDASPWCLLQGDGEGNLTDSSKKYWRHYNAYRKQVAFKDGKLLAFSANDSSTRLWWDRKDQSHYGIPVTKKVEGDELGRSAHYILVPPKFTRQDAAAAESPWWEREEGVDYPQAVPNETDKPAFVREPGTNLFRGNRQNGTYEEWSGDGEFLVERTHYVNGKENGLSEKWYPSGQIWRRAVMKDDQYAGTYEMWYENGQQKMSVGMNEKGEKDGEQIGWWQNGNKQYEARYKDGHYAGDRIDYFENGEIKGIIHYDESGDMKGTEEYVIWQMPGRKTKVGIARRVTYDEGNSNRRTVEEFWATGNLHKKEEYHGSNLDGIQEFYNADGTIQSRTHWVEGERHGIKEVWRENGQLWLRSNFYHGEPSINGIDELYDTEGNPIYRKEYKDGEVVRDYLAEQKEKEIQFSKSFNSAEGELTDTGVSVDNKDLLDEYGLSNVTLTKKGDVVTLNKVVAAEKNRGNGTRFMEGLTYEADKNGWTLALTPDDSFGASSVKRLKDFYKRFGFKENKGRNTDFTINESMVRTPSTTLLFSKANANQEMFVSNAAKAVEGIQQEKATPEQWLKMVESKGGLKAGEDKWIGLSDWLKLQDKKTLTKQEVLDYVNENKIKIEEVDYASLSQQQKEESDQIGQILGIPIASEEWLDGHYGLNKNEYGNLELGISGKYRLVKDTWKAIDEKFGRDNYKSEREFKEMLAQMVQPQLNTTRRINPTREDYTTPGLKNNREIALTVPTVESWNREDNIHFGDAGEGRAIAWIRFGETWVDGELMTEEEKKGLPERYRTQNLRWRPKKVLVIDEIQSKRHQEGREKGYKGDPVQEAKVKGLQEKVVEADRAIDRAVELIAQAHNEENYKVWNATAGVFTQRGFVTKATTQKNYKKAVAKYGQGTMDEMEQLVSAYQAAMQDLRTEAWNMENAIPAAPFEKNWHELAMKRMLRLAAEEGYDYVAWTTGEQQAERYNIGNILDYVARNEDSSEGNRVFELGLTGGEGTIDLETDEEGKIIKSNEIQYNDKNLSDVVGKDMAIKMLTLKEDEDLDGDRLRVGAEGMKGFYDQILPRFMDKYGKKWGVKTEDISLPNIYDEVGHPLVMHSVRVTPEMKESVMEGQLMFSKSYSAEDANTEGEVLAESLQFSKVTDEDLLDKLNKGKTFKAYRAMAFIEDENGDVEADLGDGRGVRRGFLYSPMATQEKDQEGKWKLRQPTEINAWEQSDEHPEKAVQGKDGKWYFILKKPNGSEVRAAYNPYIHTSLIPLNDQFTAAHKRPELVTVEVEVPESELTSGYKADKAKDSVGKMSWHAGPVAGLLPEGNKREVVLSRYNRPVRVVPNSEVADKIVEAFNGKEIPALPWNVFTPALREELAKRGVEFSTEPAGTVSKADQKAYEESLKEGQLMFSMARAVTPEMDAEFAKAEKEGDTETAQRLVDSAAEAAGYTINGYHGTTHNFTIFDRGKGYAEGNWGKGFYFTNNYDDASANYGSETGPDLQVKIERLAENMEWMDGYEDMDYDARLEEAKKMLTGENPHVITAVIRMDNPLIIDSRGGQEETYFDFDDGYNSETEEYDREESGLMLDFIEAWKEEMEDWGWDSNNRATTELIEYAYDGCTASQLETKAREILDNANIMDEEGNLASGEFLRAVFERMGFDGIIDNNVNFKFGTQRKYGRAMDGMDYGVSHIIAFKPSQIKQADPFTYDDEGNLIPLSERFNPENEDIRFSLTQEEGESDYDFANRSMRDIAGKYKSIAKGRMIYNAKEDSPAGDYDPETDIVRIFARPNTPYREYEGTFFHENLHAFFRKNGIDGTNPAVSNVIEVSRKADPDGVAEEEEKLRKDENYEEQVKAEELFVRLMEGFMTGGYAPAIIRNVPKDTADLLSKYFNAIGYDAGQESTRRLAERNKGRAGLDEDAQDSNSEVRLRDREEVRDSGGEGGEQRVDSPSLLYSKSDTHNVATFRGKPFWSGSVSLIDGEIEEVHTYEEAEAEDFHHSSYFSDGQVEKMDNGENGFFWVEDGKIYGEWRDSIPDAILKRVAEQISFNDEIRFSKSVKAVESASEGGIAAVVGEENVSEFYNDIYKAVPRELRAMVAGRAMGNGLNFRNAIADRLSEIAREGYENDESGVLLMAGPILSYYAGTSLDPNSVRYILWRGQEGQKPGDILGMAQDIAMRSQLKVGRYAEPLLFSKGELSDSLNAADKAAEETADTAKESLDRNKKDLKDLLTATRAMMLQKEYDKSTVEAISNLAKTLMKDQYIDALSRREVARLLGMVRTSVGKSPKAVKKNADALVGMVIDHLLKRERDGLAKLTSKTGSKVNATGVEVQGELDIQGQKILKAYKEGLTHDVGKVDDSEEENTLYGMKARLAERLESKDDAVRKEAEAEDLGLTLAIEYKENVKSLQDDEKGLEDSLKDLAQQLKDGKISRDYYNQNEEAIRDNIRANRIEQVESLRDFRRRMQEMMAGSVEAKKSFVEREKERKEQIHHLANSDMQGRNADTEHDKTKWDKLANSAIVRFFMKPLGTFDQMLRLFGEKHAAGEGYLWNKYVRDWEDATAKAYIGQRDAKAELDAKVSEVFGKDMIWSDLYSEENKMPRATVRWFGADGKYKEHELTQGQLLYIYMVNKMADGRMKLRKMGIMEEDVMAIKRQMDERFLTLADWLQEEYLVEKRNKYNAIHERLFGASMAAIDNYFPLVINKRDLNRNEDIAAADFDTLPSTTTGSIIKRKRNNKALDLLNADAFSVVIDHIDQMEQWAAFAEFNKDINTLLSYKRFRNQVQNMASVYGSGNVLWKNFKDVCRIAGNSYKPSLDKDSLDATAVNIAKGVTAAKISFRVYTALKQTLSMPAFVADTNIGYLAKNITNPMGAWKWAMENLPLFEKRWKSHIAGDTRLMSTDMDWKFFRSKVYDKLSQLGMAPNAFVDAWTVAVGARSMYETKYARYIKDGYSEEEADKRAKQDAVVLYNETQQSNEGAFTSAVQLDRSVLSTAITVFRNSSMGFQRQVHDSIRNLGKLFRKGYKEESIAFMTKQMMRDGLTEEQATKAAERQYNHILTRNGIRLATFGFLVEFAWNLGSSIVYLLFGDDDDEKKAMIDEAAIHALIGGTMEGLAGGNVLSEVLNKVAKGESLRNYDPTLLPIISDMKKTIAMFSYDKVAAYNELVNLAIQIGIGANPQTLTDAIVAVVDACNGDLDTSKEAMLLIMRVLQVPQSQLDKIYIDELESDAATARKMSYNEMAERYADYKIRKNAPYFSWAYSDEQEKKLDKKYRKRFKDMVKARKELKKK